MIIYMAGPYTHPDQAANIRRVIKEADRVLDKGHTPYIPHLTHFWDLMNPKPYEFWLSYDCQMLKRCDALYRMSGESKGADIEMVFAINNNIPVFHSLDEIP